MAWTSVVPSLAESAGSNDPVRLWGLVTDYFLGRGSGWDSGCLEGIHCVDVCLLSCYRSSPRLSDRILGQGQAQWLTGLEACGCVSRAVGSGQGGSAAGWVPWVRAKPNGARGTIRDKRRLGPNLRIHHPLPQVTSCKRWGANLSGLAAFQHGELARTWIPPRASAGRSFLHFSSSPGSGVSLGSAKWYGCVRTFPVAQTRSSQRHPLTLC